MKLEVGKYYRTRDGRVAGPLEQLKGHQPDGVMFIGSLVEGGGRWCWRDDGSRPTHFFYRELELVSEVRPPNEGLLSGHALAAMGLSVPRPPPATTQAGYLPLKVGTLYETRDGRIVDARAVPDCTDIVDLYDIVTNQPVGSVWTDVGLVSRSSGPQRGHDVLGFAGGRTTRNVPVQPKTLIGIDGWRPVSTELRCECGGDKAKTGHSHWCPKWVTP